MHIYTGRDFVQAYTQPTHNSYIIALYNNSTHVHSTYIYYKHTYIWCTLYNVHISLGT